MLLLLLQLPVPRQQLGDASGRMILQARQQVGEPGLRIDVVELGGLDQRVDGRGATAAGVRAGEGPVVAADSDAAQRALGGVVGQAQAAVVEEADETVPAVEAVGDRLGELTVARELGVLLGAAMCPAPRRAAGCAPGARAGARVTAG